MEPYRILVVNDDDYDATGIRTLAAALRGIADVHIVAPLVNHSGCAAAMSLQAGSVKVSEHAPGITVVHGTPADCVQLALNPATGILPWRPHLTVSGMNHGGNMGDDTNHSGTVAAAEVSVAFGIHAFAFSLACRPDDNFPPVHFDDAAAVATDLVARVGPELLAGPVRTLNVNIPDLPRAEIGPAVVCRLGRRQPQRAVEMLSPPAATLRKYRFGINHSRADAGPGTDIAAVDAGNVAVTPLESDRTDVSGMDFVGNWLET